MRSTNRQEPAQIDLSAMPDYETLTPEMVENYIRRGRTMRSQMAAELMVGGWRALRSGLSALSHRLFTFNGHLGASH